MTRTATGRDGRVQLKSSSAGSERGATEHRSHTCAAQARACAWAACGGGLRNVFVDCACVSLRKRVETEHLCGASEGLRLGVWRWLAECDL